MNREKLIKEKEALEVLIALPEDKFQSFFNTLPFRVQLLCKGGLVDWMEVLPQWYIKQGSNLKNKGGLTA